jgi:DNA-directed RNA polymerase subunit K/omega
MEIKKLNVPNNTISRDMNQMSEKIGNVYETVKIIAKRSNQISVELKIELDKKLQEFSGISDNMEETFENREQIEVSRYYEKLPKSVLVATQEFIEDRIYYRNPVKESKLQAE